MWPPPPNWMLATVPQRESLMPAAFLLYKHDSGARLGLLWRVGEDTDPKGHFWWRLQLVDGRVVECAPHDPDSAACDPTSPGEVPFAWADEWLVRAQQPDEV